MVISVSDIIQQQRQFFATGKTKDVDFRIEQLKNLKSAIAYQSITDCGCCQR